MVTSNGNYGLGYKTNILAIHTLDNIMGKIALITGASSGIGEAIARRLADDGYDLLLCARRLDRLEKLADSLPAKTHCFTLDVRDQKQVFECIENLPEAWRSIQVLVNNAGLAAGLAPIEDGNLDHWDRMIDTNVKGLLYVTKAVLPQLIANGKAHIINISSIAGKEVYPNGNVYCASKHAVDALNKGMRIDLAKYPVKVSSINPGAVETEFSIVRFDGDEEKAKQVYSGFENLVADDIADAASYIISRPWHVNINDLTIMPTAQPIASIVHKK